MSILRRLVKPRAPLLDWRCCRSASQEDHQLDPLSPSGRLPPNVEDARRGNAMKQFPQLWLSRLNDIVKQVRRRQGWGDIQAVVEAPPRAGQAPLLRLEKTGVLEIAPLDPRSVELLMRTGQEGPLLIEIRQAFLRLLKLSQRREKEAPASGPTRKIRP